jgi:hypothetical protein
MKSLGVWLLFSLGLMAAAQAAPLPFSVYSRLYVGMRESALLAQTSRPDYVAASGLADLPPKALAQAGSAAVRQYAWKADAAQPYTTVVSVSGGVVVAIQRQPDF